MSYPDLLLKVSGRNINALLPVKGRYLHKRFSPGYGGIADLIAWLRDLGLKECCIKIWVPHWDLISAVVNIATLLGLDGHAVSLDWEACLVQESE